MQQTAPQLNAAIGSYLARGYRVIAQTETTAQLVRPKKFSVVAFLLWTVCTLGPGGIIIYLPYHVLLKRTASVYLAVAPDGSVQETRGKR